MKLQSVCFLAAISSGVACAQAAPPQGQSNYVTMDRHCKEVHPGDTVNYSLTVENLPAGQPVFADLQMRPKYELPLHGRGLPAPDFHNLGGGGMGQASGAGQNIYDFSFVVPKEIFSGRYRGVEVMVKSNAPLTTADAARYLNVTRHAVKRVHEFCLTVVSPYGAPEARPEVTDFQPGPVVPK